MGGIISGSIKNISENVIAVDLDNTITPPEINKMDRGTDCDQDVPVHIVHAKTDYDLAKRRLSRASFVSE